jgi:hypothetical protein
MLTHFLASAAGAVLKPSAEATGQSVHVDGSLGPAGSPERRALSRQIEDVARIAGGATSIRQWQALLE